MASSSLSLRVDNGQRKGETLDCNPGDLIRIGRVIRGNTFAIKDPSISQKHLTVCFLAESSLWAVTDLDSSNGTFVNSTLISPYDPTPIADGDVIRIGEKTSISVHVSAPPLRRSAREKMPAEVKANKPEEIRRNGRAGRRIVEKKVQQQAVMDGNSRRAARASSRTLNTMVSGLKLENIDGVTSHSESGEVAKENNADPTGPRDNEAEDERIREEDMDKMPAEVKSNKPEEIRRNERAGRRIVEKKVQQQAVMDGNSRRATRASSRSLNTMVSGLKLENIDSVASHSESVEVATQNNVDPTGPRDKEAEDERIREEDMDKMTMAEWFDRMEEFLPKEINRVAEEIIESVRTKARRFDDYIDQLSNSKFK